MVLTVGHLVILIPNRFNGFSIQQAVPRNGVVCLGTTLESCPNGDILKDRLNRRGRQFVIAGVGDFDIHKFARPHRTGYPDDIIDLGRIKLRATY